MVMLDVSLHPLQGPYLCPPVKQWDKGQFISLKQMQVLGAFAVTIQFTCSV